MSDVIEALSRRIVASGVGTSEAINPFWRGQLERLHAILDKGGALAPEAVQKALGYNQRRLPKGVASNRELPEWPMLMQAVKTGDTSQLGKTTEHVASLHYLLRKAALDDYLALADELGVVSDIGLVRLYWYARRLAGVLEDSGRMQPQTFLEVGSGSGRFASLLLRRGFVRHYVMVDLPEMLLNAMLTARALPGVELRFGETPDFTLPGVVFWFLDTREIEKVPKASVDVAVNFNSFMEMDEDIRDFYISEVYRASRPGAIFYNVNRRQPKMTRRDGSRFDNHPMFYPYRPTDRVLEWEPDDLQQCTRSVLFAAPSSFCMSRIGMTQQD